VSLTPVNRPRIRVAEGQREAGLRDRLLHALASLAPSATAQISETAYLGNVETMGCLVVLFAFISPRLALIALWLFTNLPSRAFESWFVPFLGFFLLPWTTLAYAAMWSVSNGVKGFEWFIVILAFLIDLGSYAREGQRRAARA
jgi:hypothetical protein